MALPEPTAALRAVLDMPLQVELSPERVQQIEALSGRVRDASEADWVAIYTDAVGAVETVVAELEQGGDDLQKQLLALPDPNQLRQEMAAGPRRDMDRSKTELRTRFGELVREWSDRAKRQQTDTSTQCDRRAAETMSISEQEGELGLELSVDNSWWAQYRGYMLRVADQWSEAFCREAEIALQQAVQQATQPFADRVASAEHRKVPDPPQEDPPKGAWNESSELPTKRVEIPSTMGALGSYLRSNIMAVGMLSMVFMAIFVGINQVTGSGGGRSGGGTWMIRGALIIVALPMLTYLGLGVAKKKRASARAEALDSQKQALRRHVSGQLDANLGAHRDRLDRWLQQRGRAWEAAYASWLETQVVPTLEGTDRELGERVAELRLQHTKLQDQLSNLKMVRNRMSQNLLFDLRKRLRDLSSS